jgi:hypothetical protein
MRPSVRPTLEKGWGGDPRTQPPLAGSDFAPTYKQCSARP